MGSDHCLLFEHDHDMHIQYKKRSLTFSVRKLMLGNVAFKFTEFTLARTAAAFPMKFLLNVSGFKNKILESRLIFGLRDYSITAIGYLYNYFR